jgi:hypothetical protein
MSIRIVAKVDDKVGSLLLVSSWLISLELSAAVFAALPLA